jgi:hypothetical protein
MGVLRADTPLAASRSLGAEAPPLGVAVFMLPGADTAQGTTLAVGTDGPLCIDIVMERAPIKLK